MTTGAAVLHNLRGLGYFRTIPQEHEKVTDYVDGGLHPVEVGHFWIFDGEEYLVVRKLGHGNVSTVWLCALREKDSLYIKSPHRYVAIKVKMAATSELDQEWAMLVRLQHLIPRYVVVPQTAFHFNGPNGRHDAYLFKDIGASLSHVPEQQLIRSTLKTDPVFRYPLQVAKSIVKQVLEGLKEIHSVGIVHNDITVSNVLVVAEDVNDSPIEEIKNKREDYTPLPGGSGHERRRPSCLCGPGNLVEDAAIKVTPESTFKIIDFSHAWHISKPSTVTSPEIGLLPPEQLLQWLKPDDPLQLGPALDIWNLGVLAYELVTGAVMFLTEEGFHPQADATTRLGPTQLIDYLLLCIFNIFGTLPDVVISRWPNYHWYFDEKGDYCNSNLFYGPPARTYDFESLEKMIANHRVGCRQHDTLDMNNEEAELFLDFLRAAMIIDPAGRPSAQELSGHAWLKDYDLAPDLIAVPLPPAPVSTNAENENPRDKGKGKAKAKSKGANEMAYDIISPTDTSGYNHDLLAHYARRKYELDIARAQKLRDRRREEAHPYKYGQSLTTADSECEAEPCESGSGAKEKGDRKRKD